MLSPIHQGMNLQNISGISLSTSFTPLHSCPPPTGPTKPLYQQEAARSESSPNYNITKRSECWAGKTGDLKNGRPQASNFPKRPPCRLTLTLQRPVTLVLTGMPPYPHLPTNTTLLPYLSTQRPVTLALIGMLPCSHLPTENSL